MVNAITVVTAACATATAVQTVRDRRRDRSDRCSLLSSTILIRLSTRPQNNFVAAQEATRRIAIFRYSEASSLSFTVLLFSYYFFLLFSVRVRKLCHRNRDLRLGSHHVRTHRTRFRRRRFRDRVAVAVRRAPRNHARIRRAPVVAGLFLRPDPVDRQVRQMGRSV